jgi:hypothetical protein
MLATSSSERGLGFFPKACDIAWYMILFPSKGFRLLCTHCMQGLHCPVVLIPSLSLKKLAMGNLLCLSASAAAKRAFSILWGGAVR